MLRFAAFVSFPAMFGLCIVARELISITITDKWLPAVAVMQILCVGGAFMPLATLYGNLFNSIGRPGIYMWNTIILGLIQIGLAVTTYTYGMNTMLTAYVIANVLWLFVWQYFAGRSIGLRLRDVVADVVPYMVAAAAVMATTWLAASMIVNDWLSLATKVIMAATLYSLIMWLSGSTVFRETFRYFSKK